MQWKKICNFVCLISLITNKYFLSSFCSEPRIPNILYHEEILKIFTPEGCEDMNWTSEAETFPKFTQLIAFEPYTEHVLLGLVVSIGGLTERLVSFCY